VPTETQATMKTAKSDAVKNANIFIDVDLTLVDAQGRLLEGAREALVRLRDEGCHLFLWSSVGMDYAARWQVCTGSRSCSKATHPSQTS